jgi:hypothetical protein
MNRLLDNQYGLQILKSLAMDFKDMPAYHLGIIDEHGNVLRKSYQLKSEAERKAYTYLDRIVIILKKAIKRAEARGDYTISKALSPALFLVREQLGSGSRATVNIEKKFEDLMKLEVTLVEEELLVRKFMSEEGEGAIAGAPTNNISGASVQEPKIGKKDIKKYHGTVARRPQLNIPEVKP